MEEDLWIWNGTHNITYDGDLTDDMYDNPADSYGCPIDPVYHKDLTQVLPVRVIIVTAYICIAILAILGNTLVIWTVWRNKHMHTVTNYYIVNLAISDLLVACVVMPLKLLEYTADCSWQVYTTVALCAVVYYLLPIFVFASVLTLAATSIERYYAIVHPLSAMQINSKSRTRKIIAFTWLIPIIVASPYIYCESMAFKIYSEYGTISRQICNDRFDDIDRLFYGEETTRAGEFRKGYFIFLFFVIYLIPSVVIFTTCVKIAISLLQPITVETTTFGRSDTSRRHEENKRKVARMVIVIAITFIVSWSPQFLTVIISQLQKHSFLKDGNFIFTMLMTHLCGFVNSCVNPIIYTAMSQKFRRSFKDIVRRICFCCARKNMLPYQSGRECQRFTSTVRQTLSETEANHIPLHENHFNRANKSNSRSSSSGDSDHRSNKPTCNDKKIIKKYIFKSNGCNQNKVNEEIHKPLIDSNNSPAEQKSYLVNNLNQNHNSTLFDIEDVLVKQCKDQSDTTKQNGVRIDRDSANMRVRYLNS